MIPRRLVRCLIVLLAVVPALAAAGQDEGLAQIKERELEAVRDKISDLKESMDKRAAERDRITGDLQEAEVAIAGKRARLVDLERQLDFSRRKKAEIEGRLALREQELAAETEQLQAHRSDPI